MGYHIDLNKELSVNQEILSLVSILGPALWKVFETLLDKGKDQLLDQGFMPFTKWIEDGYKARQNEKDLQVLIGMALDDLRNSGAIDKYDSLIVTLKLTDLDKKTRLMLAGAAIGMTQFSTSLLPPELIRRLKIEDTDAELLARFLFTLRNRMSSVENFRDGIRYANEMNELGLLHDVVLQMSVMADQLSALASMEEVLIRERRLTTDDEKGLRDYLAEMRVRWEGLILPLLRKKSGAITSAKLKQVFVPLNMSDVRADEEIRNYMDNTSRPEKLFSSQFRHVEIGELVNRHDRFILVGPPGCGKTTLLNRVALAFAEGNASSELGWKGKNLFPIFLRLRNFGAFIKQNRDKFPEPTSGSLISYLENQLRSGERIRLTADFFDRRLAEGNCFVLMDGLDEVSDIRQEIARHIDIFIDRYGKNGNRFGLASRQRGYESVELTLRPSKLAIAEVNPLDMRGIRLLIGNLLVLIESKKSLREMDLENLMRVISANEELFRIAGTPLFCSALVQVYKYHGTRLPNRRVDIFDEIVDLLLGHWHAQKRYISDAEQLAIDDGTGREYREVKDAVAVKHRRLSYLAEYMQRTRTVVLQKEEAENVLFDYLRQHERVPDDETARTWSENFLRSSHELSGLFAERDPGIYTFLHKGFLEYLAASALINQSRSVVETLLENINDEWWEQVILFAGAHPKLPEDLRIELINAILDKTEAMQQGSEQHHRHLMMAGRLVHDMADYLPRRSHERIEDSLYTFALDTFQNPVFRADIADMLDQIRHRPKDLFAYISIPSPQSPFWISKYPVTNAQYARFLQAENFMNKELWLNALKFDDKSDLMQEALDEGGWAWLQRELKEKTGFADHGILYPLHWNELRFGGMRSLAPVVGITWYEANAYCKWLLANWEVLEEGQQNLGRPKIVRLPTRAEWVRAAGGEEPKKRFPWYREANTEKLDENDESMIKEVLIRANVSQSGINRNTPVWMYSLGQSEPFGLMDLGGNVWEWQANFSDKNRDFLSLSGGSWLYFWQFARVFEKHRSYPNNQASDLGFRTAIFL